MVAESFKRKLEGNKYSGYGKLADKFYEKAIEKPVNSVMDNKKLLNKLNKQIKSKKILKKDKMSLTIKEYQAPSVLGDENRFFKGELNKEKRSLYFS